MVRQGGHWGWHGTAGSYIGEAGVLWCVHGAHPALDQGRCLGSSLEINRVLGYCLGYLVCTCEILTLTLALNQTLTLTLNQTLTLKSHPPSLNQMRDNPFLHACVCGNKSPPLTLTLFGKPRIRRWYRLLYILRHKRWMSHEGTPDLTRAQRTCSGCPGLGLRSGSGSGLVRVRVRVRIRVRVGVRFRFRVRVRVRDRLRERFRDRVR